MLMNLVGGLNTVSLIVGVPAGFVQHCDMKKTQLGDAVAVDHLLWGRVGCTPHFKYTTCTSQFTLCIVKGLYHKHVSKRDKSLRHTAFKKSPV